MKYTVNIDRQAAKVLAKLPKKIQRQVAKKIDALADNPFPNGCVAVRSTKDIYRIRSGDYRIIYEVHDDKILVIVVRIGHRRDVYDRLLK